MRRQHTPTANEFARAFSEVIREGVPPRHVALFRAHALAPRATASWREIAREVGYANSGAVKLQYGAFAHRLAIKLQVERPIDGYWLDILAESAQRRDSDGHSRFRLRQAALEGAIEAGMLAVQTGAVAVPEHQVHTGPSRTTALHLVQGGITNGDLDWLKQANPKSVGFWILPKRAAVGDRIVIYIQTLGFVALARVASRPASRADWPNRYGAQITGFQLLRPPIALDSIREEFPKLDWARYPRSVTTPDHDLAARILDFLEEMIRRPAVASESRSPEADIALAEEELRGVKETTREALVQARVGQGLFREKLLRYWENRCGVTGCGTVAALRASHIKPWRSCTNAERLDPYNGLLLLGTLDLLFDAGMISFNNDGRLLVSSQVSLSDRKLLALRAGARLQRLHKKHIEYLTWHRQYVFAGVS